MQLFMLWTPNKAMGRDLPKIPGKISKQALDMLITIFLASMKVTQNKATMLPTHIQGINQTILWIKMMKTDKQDALK